ncbi:TetR/AcrR family transcriptional regulator [Kribbella sp. NPDC020789]
MAERSYHHGNLREALLDAALERLETASSAGLSLRELARDVGVSHAAPRQHFADKQALLDALTIRGLQLMREKFETALPPGEMTFQDRLTAFATAYVEFATTRPELLAVVFARKDRDGATELQLASQQTFQLPSAIIAEAQADGTIDDSDPDRVAMAVLVVLHGLAITAQAGMLGDRRIDTVIAGTVETLINGLKPRKRSDS